jgi:hypothetical protein
MKFFAILFSLFIICFGAQAQSTSILGTWAVDVDKTISIMSSSTKQQYDKMHDEAKVRASNAMKDREFSFRENGEVTVKWKSGGEQRISSGTWAATDDKLNITIADQTVSYDVEFKSADEMILRGQIQRGLFSNLYLQKR